MNKLFEFKFNGDTYEVSNDQDIYETPVIIKNGEIMSDFGETWAGTKLNASHLRGAAIAAYYNDNTKFEFSFVYEDAKKYKKQYQSYTYSIGDRQIPNTVIDSYGEMYKLVAITKDKGTELGNAYYYSFTEDENVYMTRTIDGTLASNIEAIVSGALLNDAQECDIVFMDETTRKWINDELEEEAV